MRVTPSAQMARQDAFATSQKEESLHGFPPRRVFIQEGPP